jgi:hypothetical protein
MRRTVFLSLLIAGPAAAGTPLPARFLGGRVIVDVPLTGGRALHMWSDSGGGATIIHRDAAQRLGLDVQPAPPAMIHDDIPPGTLTLVKPLPLSPSPVPPPPVPILVARDGGPTKDWANDTDGNLGQNWWAGHIWTWDYPARRLSLEAPGWQPPKRAHTIPVTFRQGVHFPRIIVTIAGEDIPVLLDTGATTYLTEDAARRIGGARLRATSMITASHIAAWRKAHPDWPVIEQAQVGFGSRMIRVPDVRIAGFEVGPVWFTERPDDNFVKYMSQMTDQPVEGAIGGNAYHSLVMTVDYLHGRAAFVQPRPR